MDLETKFRSWQSKATIFKDELSMKPQIVL